MKMGSFVKVEVAPQGHQGEPGFKFKPQSLKAEAHGHPRVLGMQRNSSELQEPGRICNPLGFSEAFCKESGLPGVLCLELHSRAPNAEGMLTKLKAPQASTSPFLAHTEGQDFELHVWSFPTKRENTKT